MYYIGKENLPFPTVYTISLPAPFGYHSGFNLFPQALVMAIRSKERINIFFIGNHYYSTLGSGDVLYHFSGISYCHSLALSCISSTLSNGP